MNKLASLPARITLIVMSALLSLQSFAQEKALDVDVDVDKGGNWYTNPIVWIIGGAVFILLLVALLRGGSNKN